MRAMSKRFNSRRRCGTGEVGIGYEACDRNRLAGTAPVEQRQLRIDARVGTRSPTGTADSNRYILGQHDVQDSILCLPVRDAGPDGLFDLRVVNLAIDGLIERELQDAQILFGDVTPLRVLTPNGFAGGTGVVDDHQDVGTALCLGGLWDG